MKNRRAEILLVVDNPLDVELSMEVLNSYKLSNCIHVVRDGEEALKFLYKKGKYKTVATPDVIFLDLNISRVDGREVLIEIKHDDKLKSIPIVILTSSELKDNIKIAYDNYANCYVTKPLNLEQFTNVVKTLNNFWLSLVVAPN